MDELETYSLQIAYDGAPFCGFARQPGQLTIQGELEHAISTLFAIPTDVVCAGRTDSGVHALGQIVSFDVEKARLEGRTEQGMLRSLNALTHDSISVRAIERREPGFSARFDAISREYRYFLFCEPYAPVFMKPYSWHVGKPLDVQAMQEASRFLIGEHDFKSFCMAASAEGRRTYRYVESIGFFTQEVMGEEVLAVRIVGNAFLHSMVRAIIGTLVTVGRSRRSPEWVASVLEACDRRAAGENAPACGLVLWHVNY